MINANVVERGYVDLYNLVLIFNFISAYMVSYIILYNIVLNFISAYMVSCMRRMIGGLT